MDIKIISGDNVHTVAQIAKRVGMEEWENYIDATTLDTEEKIKEALQIPEYSSHLFRFPGGSEGGKYKKVKNDAKGVLESNNIAFINWNCLTNDSVGKPTYESIIKDFKITQNRKKQDSCSNA